MRRTARAAEISRRLALVYPNAHCELEYGDAFQLLVATVLSAQCTDNRVNQVTRELFRSHPGVSDLARIPQEDLEKIIHSAGFFRSKAKNIRALSNAIIDLHAGQVPQSMEALSALPGVGRKTANVVLGNAFGINEGFVVDTHIARLSKRLGLTAETDPVKIERDLVRIFPREDWMKLSHEIIWHGRRRCYARNPDCAHCELADICPSFGKFGVRVPCRQPAPRGMKRDSPRRA